MRPPGNTHAPPWNASFDERRASSTSSPRAESRNNTTVAAGAATTPLGAPALVPASPRLLRSSIQLFNGKLTLFVACAQDLLFELTDRCLRDLVDEGPSFRNLPPGHVTAEVFGECDRVDAGTSLAHDASERTLAPTVVGNADEDVLELDRTDPLTARLDHILGPVGDLDIALGRHRADVARAQPALVELLRRRVAVVRRRDPRTARFDLPDRLTVPRQWKAGVVDDPQLDPAHDPSGAGPPVHLLGGSDLDRSRRMRHRREGRGLGHAPVSYTHLRAHETGRNLVCRLLLE